MYRRLAGVATGLLLTLFAPLVATSAAQAVEGPRHLTPAQLTALIGDKRQFELDDVIITGDVTLTTLELLATRVTVEGDLTISPKVEPPADQPIARYSMHDMHVTGAVNVAHDVQVFDLEDSVVDGDFSVGQDSIPNLTLVRDRFGAHVFVQNVDINFFVMDGAHVTGSAYFTASSFHDASFDDVTAEGVIQISLSQLGPDWLSRSVDTAIVSARTEPKRTAQIAGTLAFLERDFRGLNQNAEATEVHYAAIQVKRATSWRDRPVTRLLSYLPQAYNSYGTRPWQPVVIGLALVVLYGVAYRLGGMFVPLEDGTRVLSATPSWLFAQLYSLDAFVPVINVSGVRDWGHAIDDHWRWVEASERIVGAGLTVLASISLATYL